MRVALPAMAARNIARSFSSRGLTVSEASRCTTPAARRLSMLMAVLQIHMSAQCDGNGETNRAASYLLTSSSDRCGMRAICGTASSSSSSQPRSRSTVSVSATNGKSEHGKKKEKKERKKKRKQGLEISWGGPAKDGAELATNGRGRRW